MSFVCGARVGRRGAGRPLVHRGPVAQFSQPLARGKKTTFTASKNGSSKGQSLALFQVGSKVASEWRVFAEQVWVDGAREGPWITEVTVDSDASGLLKVNPQPSTLNPQPSTLIS